MGSRQEKKMLLQEETTTSSSSSSSEEEYELEFEEATDMYPQKPSLKKPYSLPRSIHVTTAGFRLAMVKSDDIDSENDKDEDGSIGDSSGAPEEGCFEDLVPKAIPLGETEPSEYSSIATGWRMLAYHLHCRRV